MSQNIVILDANFTVEVEAKGEDPIRVKLGTEPYGVTLVGDLTEMHHIIIEVDRQISRLVGNRSGR